MAIEPKKISVLDSDSVQALKSKLGIKMYYAKLAFDYGTIIKYEEVSDIGVVTFGISAGFIISNQPVFPAIVIPLSSLGTESLTPQVFYQESTVQSGVLHIMPISLATGENLAVPDEGTMIICYLFPAL